MVLQAQSQETGFSQAQMKAEVFPYAASLSAVIRVNNECSQPLFYITWGHKNGNAPTCPYLPWMCTYEGMDNAIRETYIYMAESNQAKLAAVGAVWRYLIENHPTLELYSRDGSHPSLEGSYAAAIVFYTMLYKKDPTLISWDSNLSVDDASIIKNACKTIVYDVISTWDFTTNPMADFSEVIQDNEVNFTNESRDYDSLLWDFGDATTSTDNDPIHIYTESGVYTVSLTITKCGKVDVKTKTLDITILSTEDFDRGSIKIYPNPSADNLNLLLDRSYNQIQLVISNHLGKTVLRTSENNSDTVMLNVSSLAKGTYILRLQADEHLHVKKIVKE